PFLPDVQATGNTDRLLAKQDQRKSRSGRTDRRRPNGNRMAGVAGLGVRAPWSRAHYHQRGDRQLQVLHSKRQPRDQRVERALADEIERLGATSAGDDTW